MRYVFKRYMSLLLSLLMIAECCVCSFAEEIPTSVASSYYTAYIMQGDTNEEDDCRATVNGLLDSGSYILQSISTAGWYYASRDVSEIYPSMLVSATQFSRANRYTFAYYSGHGGKSSTGYPVINYNSSSDKKIDVAATLDVATSSWRTTCEWQPSDNIRVLMLSSCSQLDSSIMKYYARAMRASGIRAIAGYHEPSPGHDIDVSIANKFFSYARTGNSVKYSWQYGNTLESTIYPWAVLVYTENDNAYYRLPGFPGDTFATPSSSASIYRFRSGMSGSQIVTTANQSTSTVNSDSIPLYITVTSRNDLIEFDGREPVAYEYGISSDTTMVPTLSMQGNEIGGTVMAALPSDYQCVQTPVYRDEVDLDGDSVEGTETVVEYIYHFFDTFNGIKIADSSIVIGVDAEGIYSILDCRKNVVPTAAQMDSATSVTSADLISVNTAVLSLESIDNFDNFELQRSELVYAPIENGSTTYKLCYQLLGTDSRMAYVDAVNGNVLDI